jgi:hypothetical protein
MAREPYALTSSLITVPLAAPVMRQVARMELPSTRQPRIRARSLVSRRFMGHIMLERSSIVKEYDHRTINDLSTYNLVNRAQEALHDF